jgi:hypothetical protein
VVKVRCDDFVAVPASDPARLLVIQVIIWRLSMSEIGRGNCH